MDVLGYRIAVELTKRQGTETKIMPQKNLVRTLMLGSPGTWYCTANVNNFQKAPENFALRVSS